MEYSNGQVHVGSRCTPRHTHTHTQSAHTHTCYLTIRSVDLLILETGVPVAGLPLPSSHESLTQAGRLDLPRDSQATHPDL